MVVKEGKRGQLTIFIILAILIIALALLIYFFLPKLRGSGGLESDNPYSYIQTCMKDKIENTIETVSLQGGDYIINKDGGFYFYRGEYVKYLCYTDEDFQPCTNQQPFLTEHVQSEILNNIKSDSETCFNSLVESYRKKGYEVDLKKGTPEVAIIPDSVSTKFNNELTITKGSENQNYKNFEIKLNSNLYNMLEVAKNIVIWEINVGDSLPEAYMNDNPYLKVEKKKKERDIKLYILTDRNTGEVFKFASRSFAAPVGFA
jgi:hypothetical protein